ncbi:MAG: hypothetical protein NC321_04035 [Clostridium sp.]|nr:hypothetical protein [Clostridium sp.]
MNRILKRIVSAIIVILMCFICITALEKKEDTVVEISSNVNNVEEQQIQISLGEEDIEETNTEAEDIEETKTKLLEEFSYSIKRVNLYDSFDSYIYDINIESDHDLYLPVPLVEIRSDKEKEKHLNMMILERCNSVLPKEKAWMDYVELRITFRSEKYLCFEYISHAAIPENYDYKQLYFTLDLEEERWEEYPTIETKYIDEYEGIFPDGGEEEEIEEFQQKTVEEQNILRGDTDYDVYEQIITCKGISTSCVQVRGLEDSDKEKQINQLLQEPLISLIQSEGMEDYDKFGDGVFEDIKIYVAYKTEEWLSVVYSIKAETPSKQTGKGLAEIGITINMRTGERFMLDDLFSLQELEGWLVGQGMNEVYIYNNIHAALLTEEEIISQLNVKGQRALLYYNTALTFYLHCGELVFMDSLFVTEIPLPEIYDYLKVDPWYE